MDILQILALAKPLLLPVLLYVGKWLKGTSWFPNSKIPYVVLVVNGAAWVLLQMGLATQTDGKLTPVTPELLGFGSFGVPFLALMAWALPGWAGHAIGTAISVAVEQVFVNLSHKGIKYRRLFKDAERKRIIPAKMAKTMRQRSEW